MSEWTIKSFKITFYKLYGKIYTNKVQIKLNSTRLVSLALEGRQVINPK